MRIVPCKASKFVIANGPMTQQQALALLGPVIKSMGHTYSKFGSVLVRPAGLDEAIETKTPDGRIETTNKGKSGDYIVRNPTGEEYIIPANKFQSRYTLTGESKTVEGKPYQVATPKGRCRGVKLTGELARQLGLPLNDKNEFWFVASWGEPMVSVEGDMLCSPVDDQGAVGQEVYRIEATSFAQTYRPD